VGAGGVGTGTGTGAGLRLGGRLGTDVFDPFNGVLVADEVGLHHMKMKRDLLIIIVSCELISRFLDSSSKHHHM
jgi:hypothetical protein